jgi:hypothetical protein
LPATTNGNAATQGFGSGLDSNGAVFREEGHGTVVEKEEERVFIKEEEE